MRLPLFQFVRFTKSRDLRGIVARSFCHLHHRDPDPGGEKFLQIRLEVGVSFSPGVGPFDHQRHLLDSFRPDDGIVLPEFIHLHVFLIDSLRGVGGRVGAAVVVVTPPVGDVAEAPCRGRFPFRFLDDFDADVNRSVSIVDRRGPVCRRIFAQLIAFDEEVGFRGNRVFLFEGEGSVEQYKLIRPTGGGWNSEDKDDEKKFQRIAHLDSDDKDLRIGRQSLRCDRFRRENWLFVVPNDWLNEARK